MATTLVPITPSVLEWAIAASGLSPVEVAAEVGIDGAELESWISGQEKPALTKCRKLAATVHRQLAVFLLPAPPESEGIDVRFRHPIGSKFQRALTPDERRLLRRARRLQEAEALAGIPARVGPAEA